MTTNIPKSQAVYITHNGETKRLYDWVRSAGYKTSLAYARYKRGWTIQEILETPPEIKPWLQNRPDCSQEGCEFIHYAKGLCKKHYEMTQYFLMRQRGKRKPKYPNGRPYSVTMWQRTRLRALSQKIPFTITPDDIIIPEYCPVLGIKLEPNEKKELEKMSRWDNSPSIDKVIPSEGYTPENIQVISNRANLLKNNGTAEEFDAISKYIKDHQRKREEKEGMTTVQ